MYVSTYHYTTKVSAACVLENQDKLNLTSGGIGRDEKKSEMGSNTWRGTVR